MSDVFYQIRRYEDKQIWVAVKLEAFELISLFNMN